MENVGQYPVVFRIIRIRIESIVVKYRKDNASVQIIF